MPVLIFECCLAEELLDFSKFSNDVVLFEDAIYNRFLYELPIYIYIYLNDISILAVVSILSCSGSKRVLLFGFPTSLVRSVSVRAACWPVVVHQLHQDIQHRKDTIKLQDHFGTARTWVFTKKNPWGVKR